MDEFDALKAIDAALSAIDEASRGRTIAWISAKYGHELVSAAPPKAATLSRDAVPIVAAPLNLSVRTIAQQLGAKSAGDVLRAAAASLTLVHGREEFTWQDLLTEAGKATGYWTKHHPSNAAQAAKRLRSDGVLVELANGNLSLGHSTRTELQQAFGG